MDSAGAGAEKGQDSAGAGRQEGEGTEKDGSNGPLQRNHQPDGERQRRREEMEGLSFTESAKDRSASRTSISFLVSFFSLKFNTVFYFFFNI